MKPNQSQNSARVVDTVKVSLALTYLKDSISEEENLQAINALKNLSFEEVIVFNQIRYDSLLKRPEADVADINYWREWSIQANQLAFKKTGKGYFALSEDEMRAVVEELDVDVTTKRMATSSPMNRRSSGKPGDCKPWFKDRHRNLPLSKLNFNNYKFFRPFAISPRNFEGTSPDCDYVFSFAVPRPYEPVGVFVQHILGSKLILDAESVARKTIDTDPQSNCGTYQVQLGIGKGRLDFAFLAINPHDIKILLEAKHSPRGSWCYVGNYPSPQMWLDGIYYPESDIPFTGNGLEGWDRCQCKYAGRWYLK